MTDTRPVVRCPTCRRVMFARNSGQCPWCDARLPRTEPEPVPEPVTPPPFRRHDTRSKFVNPLAATLPGQLRELREERHLTQTALALAAGLPRTYISRIENGRLYPGPRVLGRAAAALGVGISYFMGGVAGELLALFAGLGASQQSEIMQTVKGRV